MAFARKHSHLLLVTAAVLLAACNATKWVPPGERLLVRNVMTLDPGTLTADELLPVVKQKPNKRVLGRPLYLDLYNVRDPRKVERKRAIKDSLCVVANLERDSLRQRTCDRSSKGRNGEPPVLLDTTLTDRTVQQLRMYAIKEGYLAAEVSDTVHYRRRLVWPWNGWGRRPYKKPKAAVEYVVKAGRPWTLCTIDLRTDDPRIAAYVKEDWGSTLLKVGDRFDADVLDAERSRITHALRVQGLLYFTRDMVLFDADTSAGDHEVDLLVSFERPLAVTQRGLRGTPEGDVYHVQDVVVDITRRTAWNAHLPVDTARYEGFTVLYKGRRPEFRPKALLGSVLVKPEARFNQNDADRTFRRLTNLRVFERVDLGFDTIGIGRPGYANCRIKLVPGKRQGFSAEGFFTNRGGFLGTSGSVNYRHKNLFRTMTSFQASMTLGFEAQQSLEAESASEGASTAIGRDALFNTLEIGPEVKLGFPTRLGSAKTGGSKAVINGLFNYQRRPDYTRTLAKGSIGIEGSSSWTHSWGIYPVEFNLIRIPDRSDAFTAFLDSTNDIVLTNSYSDHVIAGVRGHWTLNTQTGLERRRHNNYLRVAVDWAGTPYGWLGEQATDPGTGDRFRLISGIRYAEYIKLDADYRHYVKLHDRSSIVFRGAVGGAKPYGNQTAMPFETSFFSGGANGMRAWRARSLGPGSYSSSTNNFDRIGEFRIEGNVEYRFKMFGYLEGALFTDVGNIWFLQENPAKPGGTLKGDTFLSEIAVGTGVGARLNFDFFLVRFDLGLQTKDPSLPAGQRWIYEKKEDGLETRLGQKLNFNLGIGYPF